MLVSVQVQRCTGPQDPISVSTGPELSLLALEVEAYVDHSARGKPVFGNEFRAQSARGMHRSSHAGMELHRQHELESLVKGPPVHDSPSKRPPRTAPSRLAVR